MLRFSSKRGFTLIELLVVVSIISLLASIILASLSGARARARNAARLEIMRTFVNAFNLSFPDAGGYPSTPGWVCLTSSCTGLWNAFVADTTVDAFLSSGLKQKPTDPSDPVRGFSGFVYYNPAAAFASPYDGYVYNAGALLSWGMEPPVTTNICGPGHIFGVTAAYVQCVLNL